MKKNSKPYKLRIFKDSAFKRYEYPESCSFASGDIAGELPNGKAGKIIETWMGEFFPFCGIVKSKNATSVDIQVRGIATVKIGGKK